MVCSAVPATQEAETGGWLSSEFQAILGNVIPAYVTKEKEKKISWLSQQKKDRKLCAPVILSSFKMVNTATYNYFSPNYIHSLQRKD